MGSKFINKGFISLKILAKNRIEISKYIIKDRVNIDNINEILEEFINYAGDTEDKIINITGESGSGKTYYTSKYLNDDNYIVIDTDLIFSNKPTNDKDCLKIREIFKDKPKDILITDFDNCYLKILDYYKNSDKTIVIDSAQYRNIKDCSLLKGKLIVMRTSINTCYERVLSRWKNMNKEYTKEEYFKYAKRKKGIFKWYKGINKFLENVEKL